MRILIVKTSSMGDVVHALPAVSDLAAALPEARIDWLVERAFAAIPQQHRAVRRVIPLAWRKWRRSLLKPSGTQARAEFGAWWSELRGERYDLVIDLQGLVKSALFASCAHGPRAGYDRDSIREPLASLFYGRSFAVPRNLQAVVRCRRLVAAILGRPQPVDAPDFGLRGREAPADAIAAAAVPEGDYGVLIPCASRAEKLWPEDAWIALGRQWLARGRRPVILWGSPEEEARARRIAQSCEGSVPPFLSVGQTMPLLAGAQEVIGLDTGLTHLAAAFGPPTLGIYCDHDPGLAGVTGPGRVASVGGKGVVPGLEQVQRALADLQHGP
ncbi:MAG: lipopolysaccharide heptosyltransferase I [Aquabacterium sp.]|nr:MAG: lipopolysaccharide heptosyltransferase I [Aquabacterium sp.]